jgi:hypothetical protein
VSIINIIMGAVYPHLNVFVTENQISKGTDLGI